MCVGGGEGLRLLMSWRGGDRGLAVLNVYIYASGGGVGKRVRRDAVLIVCGVG